MLEHFQYPFDSTRLYRSRKDIREKLTQRSQRQIKLYILSGSTVGELKEFIDLFLLNFGIRAEVKVGDYNAFYEEAMFGEQIASFDPDWIYVHTSIRNVRRFPSIEDGQQDVDALVLSETERLSQIAEKLSGRGCKIILNNFERPVFRSIGNLSSIHTAGSNRFVRLLNDVIEGLVTANENVFLNDIDYLSSVVGLDNWHDWNYWSSFKYAMAPTAMPWIGSSIASIIAAGDGAAKKALLCDLDNTLWGGTIGDEGVEKIALGPDTAKGEIFSEVQSYIKDLKSRGIAIAVNSKNNEENARSGFSHDSTELQCEDFAEFLANWNPKSQNVSEIEKSLNISADSFVFLDDSPAEIAEVEMHFPEILAFSYKKTPIELITQIDRIGVFEQISISAEDTERQSFFQSNQKRERLRQSSGSLQEYLQSLNMTAQVSEVNTDTKDRCVQLVNKTNQFNPMTRRIDGSYLHSCMEREDCLTLNVRLQDRYGNNGITSVLIVSFKEHVAEIDVWVMSCRVFNRELELAIFDVLVDQCRQRGITRIEAAYKPSAKNGYVKNLYGDLGFDCVSEIEDTKHYCFEINESWQPRNKMIEISYGKP